MYRCPSVGVQPRFVAVKLKVYASEGHFCFFVFQNPVDFGGCNVKIIL